MSLENFVAFFSASEMGERRCLKGIAADWKRIKGGQEPEEASNNLPAICIGNHMRPSTIKD